MEIFVNGRPIEFEVNGGETLSEVVSSLNEWAYKGGNTITELIVDGKRLELQDAIASSCKIDEIKRIEMEIRMPEELALSSMEDAVPYIDRLLEGIKGIDDIQKLHRFIDGINWLKEVVKRSEDILRLRYVEIKVDNRSIEERKRELEEVIELLKEKREDLSNATDLLKKKVGPILEEWRRVIPRLLEEVPHEIRDKVTGRAQTTIIDKLDKAMEGIPEISRTLETISLDLQTGNEHRAMESLQRITDELSGMIRLLQEAERIFGLDYRSMKIGDQTIHERSVEMDELLSEMITAFENEDIVMLADLLEYELSPLIMRWREVIEGVVKGVRKG